MEEPVFLTHRLIIARHFYLLDTRRFCARKKSSPICFLLLRSRKNFHWRRRAKISPERCLLIRHGEKTTGSPRRFNFGHRQKPKLSPKAKVSPPNHHYHIYLTYFSYIYFRKQHCLLFQIEHNPSTIPSSLLCPLPVLLSFTRQQSFLIVYATCIRSAMQVSKFLNQGLVSI